MTFNSVFFLLFSLCCSLAFELAVCILRYLTAWATDTLRTLCSGIGKGHALKTLRSCLQPTEIGKSGEMFNVLRVFTVFASATLSCYVFLDGEVRVSHAVWSLLLIWAIPKVTESEVFLGIVDRLFYLLRLSFLIVIFLPYFTVNIIAKNTISLFRQISSRFFVKNYQKPQK